MTSKCSLVSKECKNEDYLVPLIKHSQEETRLDPNSEDTSTYDFKNKFTPGEDLDDGIKMDDEGGYEGAIVLEPKKQMYLDDPVACVDYSSLYPSCIISENISLRNYSMAFKEQLIVKIDSLNSQIKKKVVDVHNLNIIKNIKKSKLKFVFFFLRSES